MGLKSFVDKQYVMLNLLVGYCVHLVCLGFCNFPSSEILSKKLMKDVNCSIMGDEFLLDCGAKFQR